MQRAFLILLFALGACTQFPELNDRVSPLAENAEFPDLVPLEPLLAKSATSPQRGIDIAEGLGGRVASLRARADRLRRNVLSASDRARLSQRPGT